MISRLRHRHSRRLLQDGRAALSSLLDKNDYRSLLEATASLPVFHDGVTISSPLGQVYWRTISEPGERCIIERRALCDILRKGIWRDGVDIEYDKGVRSITYIGGKWTVQLWNGDTVKADVLVGLSSALLPQRSD